MHFADLLTNVAANYAQKGIDKVTLFWKNKQFYDDINQYFSRYKSSVYENILRECEFDIETLREKLLGELLPELVISCAAPHLQQRKKARISFLNSSYAYSSAKTIKQQQTVYDFLTPIFKKVDSYLQDSAKENPQYAANSAVEDIEDIIKQCLVTLKTDISSIKHDLEVAVAYSGSFAEFIDQIAPKPVLHIPFHYLNPRISFFGRINELQILDSFLSDSESIRMCVVSGVGGSGKSKLVHEFIRIHSYDTQWKFVYIQPDRFDKIINFNKWDYDQYLVVVIDYAGSISEKIGSWLRSLCSSIFPSRPRKIRLILLERQGIRYDIRGQVVFPHWYQQLIGTGEQRHIVSPLLYQQDIDHYFISLGSLQNRDFRSLISSYSDSQFAHLEDSDVTIIMNHMEKISAKNPQTKIPLFILFITDAYLNRTNFRRWNVNSILEFVLERLINNLQVTICRTDPILFEAVYQILIYSTAVTNWEIGVQLPAPFNLASTCLNSLDTTILSSLVQEINNINYETNRIFSIEPDIIGEFLVLNYAKNNLLHCNEIFKVFWLDSGKFLSFIKNAINDYGRNRYFSALFDSDLSWLLCNVELEVVRKVRYELWLELLFASTFRRAKNILSIMQINLVEPNYVYDDLIYYSRAVNYSLETFSQFASRRWIEDLATTLGTIYNTLYETSSTNGFELSSFVGYYVSAIRTEIQIFDEYGLGKKIESMIEILTRLSSRHKELSIDSVITETEEILMAYIDGSSDDDIAMHLGEIEFIDVHPSLRIPNVTNLEDSQGAPVDPSEWYLYGININKELSGYDNFFSLFQSHDRFFDHHVSYSPYSGNRVYYVDEDNSDVYFVLNYDFNVVDIVYPIGYYHDSFEFEFEFESSEIDFRCNNFLTNE